MHIQMLRISQSTVHKQPRNRVAKPLSLPHISSFLSSPSLLTPADVQMLQRTVGNRMTAHLLRNNSQTTIRGAQAHSDPFEREADSIARQVSTPKILSVTYRPSIQRQSLDSSRPAPSAVTSFLPQTFSTGRPLPEHIRRKIETKTGSDLSSLRIHTDHRAAQMNAQLGAKAFTHKNHIYYAAGQSPSNLYLSTHEAVHAIQQGAAPAADGQIHTVSGPVVQCLLESGTDFLNRTDANDRGLYTIAVYMTMYNRAAAIDDPDLNQINQQFRLLRLLHRQVLRWFDGVSTQYSQLNQSPHYEAVATLLRQVEDEYEELVDRYKDDPSVIPFDLGGMDVEEARELWQSIVHSRGKIKLVGSEGYNRSILAQLAQILNTPTGKELLGYLNRPTLLHPESDPLSNIYIGDDVERLPSSVRKESLSLHTKESSAQGLGKEHKKMEALGSARPFTGSEYPGAFPTVNAPVDFKRVILSNPSQKSGISFGGQKYIFSKGTGSFVTTSDKPSILAGPHYHEILGPRYITLAHELGHAAHTRTGATTGGMNHSEFMDTLSGHGDHKLTESIWDNSEEFFTIHNWENPIRQESGLTTLRTGHRTPNILTIQEQLRTQPNMQLLQQQREANVRQRIGQLLNRDPLVTEDKVVGKLPMLFEKQKDYFHADIYYNEFDRKLRALEDTFSLQNIRWYKREIIRRKFAELEIAWKFAKSGARRTNQQNFDEIKNEVETRIGHYIAAGNYNDYRRLVTRIDELIRALPQKNKS